MGSLTKHEALRRVGGVNMLEMGPMAAVELVGIGVNARRKTSRAVWHVLAGCFVLALAAQVRIPVPGSAVPLTLQTFAVLLVGFALSPGLAVAATMLYVGIGAVGLPVFAPHSTGLAGPTGGYLLGFVVAAWVVSMIKGGDDSGLWRLLWAGITGIVTVFTIGLLWLVYWCRGDVGPAVAGGLMPFLAKEVVQLPLAVMMVMSLRRRQRG